MLIIKIADYCHKINSIGDEYDPSMSVTIYPWTQVALIDNYFPDHLCMITIVRICIDRNTMQSIIGSMPLAVDGISMCTDSPTTILYELGAIRDIKCLII